MTIDGQRIAVITATQVIADNLVSTWTASSTQPGVASAIDPTQLVREVQQVRRTADTVIVYVHWGTETQACPNPQQEPLAEQLVKAGADIVIGSGTHVLLGAGYLGERLRRLRPRQPRLLRQHGPRDRQRDARRHRAGSPHHGRRLAPRHHPQRRAPAADAAPRPRPRSRAGTPPAAAPTCRPRPDEPRHHARRDRSLRGARRTTDHDDHDGGTPSAAASSTTTTTTTTPGTAQSHGGPTTTTHQLRPPPRRTDHSGLRPTTQAGPTTPAARRRAVQPRPLCGCAANASSSGSRR